MKLAQVIEELVEEKGLDRPVLSSIICEGMLAAYTKKYPDLQLSVEYDKKSDEIKVFVQKDVVAAVDDEYAHISLRKARNIDPDIELGDKIKMPFEGKIGRIEILRAKQIIAQQIRSIETTAIFEQFKEKKNTIITGVVHKCEQAGAVIKVDEVLAFLPKSLMIPGERCIPGYSIRALLKDVLPEPRNDNQLILDRASAQFVEKLFELEIPEVFEKLVEIKKIVRSPGYKTKVVVQSHDINIDPVGTCVGVGGARIKPILKELGTEKIDVIAATDSLETLIQNSLKPAVINRVEVVDAKNAQVWVDEDQRSLAIGKMGQNISLASQVTGVNINLVSNTVAQSAASTQEAFEEALFDTHDK